MNYSILWGTAFSLATSILKAVGLPDRWAFLINLFSGAIYGGFLVTQGKTWKEALNEAIIAVGVSYGVFKTVSKPVRELVSEAASRALTSKKTGGENHG